MEKLQRIIADNILLPSYYKIQACTYMLCSLRFLRMQSYSRAAHLRVHTQVHLGSLGIPELHGQGRETSVCCWKSSLQIPTKSYCFFLCWGGWNKANSFWEFLQDCSQTGLSLLKGFENSTVTGSDYVWLFSAVGMENTSCISFHVLNFVEESEDLLKMCSFRPVAM